jgi:SAM-dependent methyltransferase
MVLLFACTLFLSSTLLFLVQPMIAKMVLPLLGGTPAVWNTCMVFFQTTLLLGYLYVHAVTRWLRVWQQAVLHVALLGASLLALPVALAAHDEPPAAGMPILWLARVLLVSVGVPFFVASTSGPLLQRWFARTGHARARDPYFLSVAGNLGSIVALLAYPAGLEPTLRLADQSWLWAAIYGAFVSLMLGSIWIACRSSQAAAPTAEQASPATSVPVGHRLRWIALAFVPSSLMLGLTTYLTTDVAPVPLFWVVPLTLYLASFVLVFARRTFVPHALMLRLLPIFALVLVAVILFGSELRPAMQAPIHLAMFFTAAMVCHGELARSRPDGERVTDFYLMMSLGGVLGGLFNALVAPLAFHSVVEYPLAIVLACAARPSTGQRVTRASVALDVAVPAALGVFMLVVLSAFGGSNGSDPIAFLVVFMLPTLLCFSLKARPVRFALGLGALMLASSAYLNASQAVSYRGRSYFSVYKITTDARRQLRLLVHGRIIHGAQSFDPAKRREPLTYFHRTGPIGQAFAAFDGPLAPSRVGVVGLGAGSLAAYAQPGQHWTFYEIDPSIEALARDTRYFTFLQDAPQVRVVLGDARLSLMKEPPGRLDFLIVDAFGSDAIPVHLLTREALQLYFRTLAPGGVVAFHVSNRYMDLQPLLGDLAGDAGAAALAQSETRISAEEQEQGKTPSTWVLMARVRDQFGPLVQDSRWRTLGPRARPVVWTDDFSNPLSVMRWF